MGASKGRAGIGGSLGGGRGESSWADTLRPAVACRKAGKNRGQAATRGAATDTVRSESARSADQEGSRQLRVDPKGFRPVSAYEGSTRSVRRDEERRRGQGSRHLATEKGRGYHGSAHGRNSLLRSEEQQGRGSITSRDLRQDGRLPATHAAYGGSAAAELPRVSSCPREAACVRHGSTAKRSRKANTSMVAMIAGLANRRSSAMLRAALRARRLLGLASGGRYDRKAPGALSEATTSRLSSVGRLRFAVTRRSGIPNACATCWGGAPGFRARCARTARSPR